MKIGPETTLLELLQNGAAVDVNGKGWVIKSEREQGSLTIFSTMYDPEQNGGLLTLSATMHDPRQTDGYALTDEGVVAALESLNHHAKRFDEPLVNEPRGALPGLR